jgi:F0F1-type ATP synthase membrane subunit b/b'
MLTMIEDADTAQARELLHSLYAHVDEISQKLETAEQKTQQTRGRVESVVRRQAASLRRELYEAHRLIDGIHGRFPLTRPPRRWESHTAHQGGVSGRGNR